MTIPLYQAQKMKLIEDSQDLNQRSSAVGLEFICRKGSMMSSGKDRETTRQFAIGSRVPAGWEVFEGSFMGASRSFAMLLGVLRLLRVLLSYAISYCGILRFLLLLEQLFVISGRSRSLGGDVCGGVSWPPTKSHDPGR